jgi:S1-C subfamily serine protease
MICSSLNPQIREVPAMKRALLLCIVSAVLGALVAIALYDPPETQPKIVAQEAGKEAPLRISIGQPAPAPPPLRTDTPEYQELTPEERVNVAVYERANRSAVNIMTESVQVDRWLPLERISEGEGSGTVIDREGHILTNLHVVGDARQIQVTLYNGKTYDARIVGQDPDTDVAVLKIDAPADVLYPVTFGNSAGLKVGQRVYAIGNPFGLERTLSTGIVSSLDRSLPRRGRSGTIKSIIQIDAAINPGSSGGPLLDSRGRMIGMNTAIFSKTGESAGVGFAISINTIARVVPQLIQNGRVRRASIGITRVYPAEQGLRILTLAQGGAAEKAGLRGAKVTSQRKREGFVTHEYTQIDRFAGDVIVGVDDKPVRTVDDLLTVIESKQPGDEVALKIIRDGREISVPVRLGTSD